MSARAAETWLIAAATFFWLSWSLMPGVGITDARQILDLVAQQRDRVGISVVLQLLSAACYAPALAGVVAQPDMGSDRHLRWGAIVLAVGAMGSAADAVFHLLAHAMTAPGLDPAIFVPLMQVVQGPGLRFILPLIASFFIGSLLLSVALPRRRLVSPWNPALHGLALGLGLVGAFLASRVGIAGRTVGLAVLGLVAGAQCWAGFALGRIHVGPRA